MPPPWNNIGIAFGNRKFDDAVKCFNNDTRKIATMAWPRMKKVVPKLLGRTTEADAAFSKAKELDIRANPGSKWGHVKFNR